MKNVFKLLGVLVFLTFISVDAKSQYITAHLSPECESEFQGSNECACEVGCEVSLPFCDGFRSNFVFHFEPSATNRTLVINFYDANGMQANQLGIPLFAGESYISFVSTVGIWFASRIVRY